MNRLKLLAAAMLLAAPIACGDEVLPPPPTGSIDGLVSIEGQGIDAVSVTLSNGASATTANGGMFRFDGVEAGAYTVTISKYPADASFDQTSAAATISTDGETVTVDFPGTFIRTSSIMGTVTVENEGLVGVTVKLSGTGESETLTDGNGQYAFAGLRAGNYTIEISGFDDEDVSFGSSSSAATVAVGESKVVSFEGTYLRTSGILGQVTADNQPQEAVTVSLQGRGENRSMTTNSAGQYSFDGLRSGDYAIGISGYNTDEVSFDVTSQTVTVAYGETATLPFEGTLLRTAGIMGTVTVEGVGPIPDVTVTIQGQGETKSMPTNSDGVYSFNRLHAGDYSVTISGFDDDEYGFNVTTATVTVALQDTETVAFDGIMLRTAGISGEVTVGDDDAPLSGVTVTVSGGPRDEDHSATTHSDGTYLVENLHAGDYSVVISGYDTREYGFDPTTETVSVGLRETLEVAFQGTLLRTAGVSGRVSVNGMGIPGVTVTLTGEEDRDPENTNADGQFGFSGLAAGDYTLTISEYDAVEYAFEPTREFALELDGAEIENFTGRALRTATVMGYVTVGDAPLPGIDVTLIMVVGTSGAIVDGMPTGDNGGYTFGPLLAGAYQVRIGEYADEYDFAAGDMQVTAVMTDSTATVNFAATIIRTASVSGRVTIDGDPMKDVTVTLTGDHAPDDNSRMTGDYGMYEFDDLRKGDYTLTISGYDAVDYHFEPTRESFALELGGSEIKNFTGKAQRTATVMGYVTVENAPLPGIGVTLIMVTGATSGEIVGAMATGADGGYTFGPLLAGAYQVRIGEYDDEYDFAVGNMQVTAVMTDSTATVNFAATIIRTASVSGMVTIDGEAMKDIEVTLTGEHAPDDNSKMTGVDGSYSFDELRKGDYTVTMTNPDGNAYSFPTVATPVNLGVGQEQPGISFAGTRLKRASISGQVYAAGDPVANVTVTLSGDATGEDMTDANGEYNFPGLAIGSYTVTISGWAEAAYIFNAPASDAEIVNNDDFLIVDFEGEHTKTASIGGMLFIDEGGQTALARDAGEPVLDLTGVLPEGMTGLPLTLLGPELTSPPTAGFASREGMYEFPGLQAGTYVINVDEATVEDMLAGLGYEYTGPSLILVSVAAAEEKTDVNLPFKITLQTINVGAVMGTPYAATATLVGGVKLALYPTLEAAEAGTPILGTAMTDTTTGAAAKFEFPRAMDLGPGGTGNDRLVFAKVMDEGHADLEFSDNKEIEIQYAATDRVSNALAAARLVNVQVNFQWSVKSNETAKDGNEFLEGWVAANGMATDASGLATYSERLTGDEAIAGALYMVMLDTTATQTQPHMGEKWVQSDAKWHAHNALLLPDAERLNDLGPIYVTWTTQSLTLGVYREADDVEGYTNYRSALPSGDVRPDSAVGKAMTVELLARESGTNRLRRHKWEGNEGYQSFDANGMVTFTGIDADVELTVRYRPGNDRIQMDYGYDEIETFGADLDRGVTLGAFGGMSGGQPEVRMCSASDATNADATSDEWCATFAYQWNTGTVYGTVGLESGHEVTVDPETGHGAIGDEDETDTDGAYSIGDLQDGVYTATAASGDPDYPVRELLTPAEVEGIALYHNEECWAATNPEPATGVRPSSCALDEVDVEDDDGTTTYTYVNRHEESWLTGNQPPEVTAAIADLDIEVGDSEAVDVSENFSDPDGGDDLTYTAASSADAVATVSVSGAEVNVTGVAAGSATVTVTATDPGGLSATQTFDVTVANQAPLPVGEIADQEVAPGGSAAVDVSGNFSDPDGDDLIYTAASSADAFATVSVDGSMVTVVGVAAGEAAVTVWATDPGDLSATQMFDVTVAVANQAPLPVGEIADQEVAPGGSEAVDVSGNFSDPDDDDAELTYTAASSDDAVATVSFSGAVVTVEGVAAGSATVTVTATDPGGLSATQMFDVTVAVANQSPEAVGTITDQTLTVGGSATAVDDVSEHFSDPDDDELTYTAASSDDAVATVSVLGAVVTVAGVAAGSATVTVTATDPGGLTATQTFGVTTVVPANQDPVPVGTIDAQTVTVGESEAVDVAGNFSDPDGDDLIYTAASSDDAVATVSVLGAVVNVAGVAAGSATVTVTATDPGGLTATQTFGVTTVVPANQDPVPVGTIDAQTVTVGESEAVDVAGNFSDPDGDDLIYTAASSDDAVATVSVLGAVVTVAGVAAGSATVTVTATDPGGLTATQTFGVTTVVPANQDPVPVGTIDAQTVTVGESEAVDVAGNFSDPDGDDLIYTAASSDDAVATVSVLGAVVTVAGVAAGSATVTVTATDPGGLTATQTFGVTTVVPANQDPVPVGTIDAQTVTVGESEAVDVAGNFSDPDGDDLIYTAASSDDAVATVSVLGAVVNVAGVAAGSATVTVTATDPGGLTATQTFGVTTVVPANQDPVPVGTIDAQTVTVGESEAVDVAGNFSDPDGDDLIYTAASSDDAVATVSVLGAVVTVAGVAAGSATVTVTATDPGGLTATQTFGVTTVVPANQDPVPVGTIDAQTVTVGESEAVDVAGNFSDPDGDDLIYTAASSDDAVATVSVLGAVVNVAGVAAGSATVTVTATDPGGLTATQTFGVTTVVPANQDPVPVGTIDAQTVTVGESEAVDVAGNFSDPDGDDLIYTAASSDDAVATVSVLGAVVNVAGVAAGSATVTVTATDPGGLTATQTFGVTTVVPANQDPVPVGTIDAQTVTVGESEAVDVAGNFSDPDGDDLIYTAASSDDAVATVSVLGAVVTVAGVAAGSATVTVTATDPGGLTATQTFGVTTVVPANQDPVPVGTIDAQTVTVGESERVDVAGNFSDPDGDDLIYTAASSDDAVATVSVSGAVVNVAGVAAGSATVTVTATDPGGLTATQTFGVTVTANQDPVPVGTIAEQTVMAGESATVDVAGNFSDPDGDDLIYTAASSDDAVATVSVSGAVVTVAGVVAGSATVTVTATDPGGLTATQTFGVTVTG